MHNTDMDYDIKTILKQQNVADLLSEEELAHIGASVVEGYEIDEESRAEWLEKAQKALDLANQKTQKRSFPFPNASNAIYPLISRASIDFASRTLPTIVQREKVVYIGVSGKKSEEKLDRAKRVAKAMSYQLLNQDKDWFMGTDKLLSSYSVVGMGFKKTYYDPVKKHNRSIPCHAFDVVVNHNVCSLREAPRITHLFHSHRNDLYSRMALGDYRELDLDTLLATDSSLMDADTNPPVDLLEQHCYLDLDGDGYSEPYMVTVHKESQEVLNIVPNFDKQSIHYKKDKLISITPYEYFTDFHFMPNPDGGFYSIGLGTLLLHINTVCNTLINQLIDAGSLANSQGGFIGRGLRMKAGKIQLKQNEWKVIDTAGGMNIRENIVPLPVREPSAVLFQMLGLMLEAGKDLSTVQDAMQGKGQTQNVPATTILTMVEQGLKVFSAVQRRLYDSLCKEYTKLFTLNQRHLTDKVYREMIDDNFRFVDEDFDTEGMDVQPVADPTMSSDAQRMSRALAVREIPGLNPKVQTIYMLDALQIPKEEQVKLLDVPVTPDPELLKAEFEQKTKMFELEMEATKLELEKMKFKLAIADTEARTEESQARVKKMEIDGVVNISKTELSEMKAEFEARLQQMDQMIDAQRIAGDQQLKARELELKTKEVGKDDNE